MLTLTLEYYGYEVESLNAGDRIFEKLYSYHADLLLMDIMIAGMDGREICRDVKRNASTSDIPVLLMSGSHRPELTTNVNEAADGFFEKPFDIDRLIKEIGRLAA